MTTLPFRRARQRPDQGRDAEGALGRQGDRRPDPRSGPGFGIAGRGRGGGQVDGVEKVLNAEDGVYDHDLAEPVAALIASIAEPYDTIIASASTTGKNVLPLWRPCSTSRRSPTSSRWLRPTRSIGRSMPATRSRPAGAGGQEGDHRADGRHQGCGRGWRGRPGRGRVGGARPRPAARPSRARRSPSRIARSWPRRGSSCPAAARSARPRSSTSCRAAGRLARSRRRRLSGRRRCGLRAERLQVGQTARS